jgi:hypothetical protein
MIIAAGVSGIRRVLHHYVSGRRDVVCITEKGAWVKIGHGEKSCWKSLRGKRETKAAVVIEIQVKVLLMKLISTNKSEQLWRRYNSIKIRARREEQPTGTVDFSRAMAQL